MQEFVDSKNRPFIAWDGEGWNDHDGEHRYMLLANSYGEHVSAPQLSTRECLNFVLDTAVKYPKHVHVIYGGGYDATHFLRDMPQEKRDILKAEGEVVWFSRDESGYDNRYAIQYIPHKWLQITGWSHAYRKTITVKIFDVITFFQASFMSALDSRKIDVPEVIKDGKAGRNTFTYKDLDEITEYCLMELKLTVELMNILRAEFQEAGVYVTTWHGPGAVASATFKEYKVKDHMQRPPLHIERAAQCAYFGGRFEQFKAGHHNGKVYVYDINSAYPDKIRDLPSLAGSSWIYATDCDASEPGLYYCTFESDEASPIAPYPTPWRGKGGKVGFPEYNKGVWLWHFEAKFATTIHYGYRLKLANDSKPFAFVEEMYTRRRKWKALGKGGERALKLALNSLYGKMAQRIGGNERNGNIPPWHQLEWAGMVTSATRAQIWEAVRESPENIIAIETDSIASTVPLNLDIGEGLGQWEYKEYDWITYVQSGVYFTPDYYYDSKGRHEISSGAHGTKAKSRGIDVTQLDYNDVLGYLRGTVDELLVTTRQFIGLNNPQKWAYGQWLSGTKTLKVAGSKRVHIPANCAACALNLPMDEVLHDLTSNPLYGGEDSLKHPLPWLDDEPLEDTEEMMKITTDAISKWETSGRHIPEDSLEGIPW